MEIAKRTKTSDVFITVQRRKYIKSSCCMRLEGISGNTIGFYSRKLRIMKGKGAENSVADGVLSKIQTKGLYALK